MRFLFRQEVPAPPDAVSGFFRDAANLPKVNPPFPRIRIVGPDTRVEPGAEILLRLGFGPIGVHWKTTIEEVQPDGTFTDTFSGLAFKKWRHTHAFLPAGTGCTIVDEIEADPVWWFRPFTGLFVRSLFALRKKYVARVFS